MPARRREPATVVGAGLAGLTCAFLLARQGRTVTLVASRVERGAPALVLSEPTVALLRAVWEDPGRTLLCDSWALKSRCVRWGVGVPEQQVPQPSLVVEPRRLLRRLEDRLLTACSPRVRRVEQDADAEAQERAAEGGWRVYAYRGPGGSCAPDGGSPPAVGRRCVLNARARLTPGSPSTTSWLTTTPLAWVYLAPVGDGWALVQAMTPAPPGDPVGVLSDVLAVSGTDHRLVEPPREVAVVPAAPWLASPSCGPGWLGVGGAALRLDPLSGAGAGHALRTAVLAAATVQAVDDGLPAGAGLDHYAKRLGVAFLDHLSNCLSWYRTAFAIPQWQDELDAMGLTVAAGRRQPGRHRFDLRLQGTRLVRCQAALASPTSLGVHDDVTAIGGDALAAPP